MNNLLEKKFSPLPGSAQDKSTSSGDAEALPNSMMEDIVRGTLAPTCAMLGHRENLSPSLQTKMQVAFGADFSNLEVYRSETARDVGMLGVASGNKVALSPDIDLNSHSGQAVLGHELSHVVAQAKGIGAQGRGIMETPSLERQAMIEGERAASGMRAFAGDGLNIDAAPSFSEGLSSFGGETLTPISAKAGAFGMGAPMQGKFFKPDEDETQAPELDIRRTRSPMMEKVDPDNLAEAMRGFGLNSESSKSPFAKDNYNDRTQLQQIANAMDRAKGQLSSKRLPSGISVPDYLSQTDPIAAKKNKQFKTYQQATYVEGANWGGALTKEELAATLLYTGSQYKQFHNAAAGSSVDAEYALEGEDAATGFRKAIGAVNSGLNKFENHYTRRLYKGMNPGGLRGLMSESQQEEFDHYQLSSEESKNPAKALAAKIRHVMSGAVVASRLLCSTSYDEAVASGFASMGAAAFGGAGLLLDIEHPPGAPGAPLGPISVNFGEDEFLLPAGVKMQVTNIEENGKIVTLHVRTLPKTDEGVERKEPIAE